MAKPPRTTASTSTSDRPVPSRSVQDTSPAATLHLGIPDIHAPSPGPRPGTVIATADDRATSSPVVISHVTDPVMTALNSRMAEITFPESQIHLLRPHDSVDGLYLAPDGRIYAPLQEGGHYLVERNAAGNYQIPWPVAPGISPPILRKIDGQALWRIAEWYMRQTAVPGEPTVPTGSGPTSSRFLDPHLANRLPAAQPSSNGIRQGPHGRIYVDTVEGTVMVRKNHNGEYQLASATMGQVPVEVFEQIPGGVLWRRKSQASSNIDIYEPQPGPSKRPRLAEDADASLLRPATDADDGWRSWGSDAKPLTGDFIEIDGKHYRIAAQPGHADDALVFISHPLLASADFDAFEGTLLMTPELQPRGAVKLANQWTGLGGDKWRVVDGLPFKSSLTQQVQDTFRIYTDVSACRIAREMFIRANHANEMTGHGISDLFDIFKYWERRPHNSNLKIPGRQDLMDPLLLLSPLPKDANNYVHLPPASAEGLHRIDIDTLRLFGERYPVGRESQRADFTDILQTQGYRVSPTFRRNAGDALLISRTGIDAVYILFHDSFSSSNSVSSFAFDTTQWLQKRALTTQIDADDKKTLREHHAAKKIIYLLGGYERFASGQTGLVITRIV